MVVNSTFDAYLSRYFSHDTAEPRNPWSRRVPASPRRDLSSSYTHVVHPRSARFHGVPTSLSTGPVVRPLRTVHCKTKRPGAPTPGPLLVRPPLAFQGGTVREPTRRRTLIAKDHLLLLRDEHERVERQDRTYVRLAHEYGMGEGEIATLSGIPVERVRVLLGGEQ